MSDVLQFLEIDAVTNEVCSENHWLGYLSSIQTFCGGKIASKSGPCQGDSGKLIHLIAWASFNCFIAAGGGFYTESSGRSNLQGIVSSSYLDEDGICDLSMYSVFTNVGSFVKWIRETVQKQWNYIEMECEFKADWWVEEIVFAEWIKQCFYSLHRTGRYMCNATFPIIDSANVKIYSVNGKHKDGKSIHDVTKLVLRNSASECLPNNIGAHFPELERIYLESSSLKFITRENFKFMENVIELYLVDNQISELSNQFDDLVNLEILVLSHNHIKVVSVQLLKNLKKLEYFDAAFNEIEHLEAGFDNNKEVTTINFECNKLKKISVDFTKLKTLKNLVLVGNDCIDKKFKFNLKFEELHRTKFRNDAQKEIFGKCTNFIANESFSVNKKGCLIPRNAMSALEIRRNP